MINETIAELESQLMEIQENKKTLVIKMKYEDVFALRRKEVILFDKILNTMGAEYLKDKWEVMKEAGSDRFIRKNFKY